MAVLLSTWNEPKRRQNTSSYVCLLSSFIYYPQNVSTIFMVIIRRNCFFKRIFVKHFCALTDAVTCWDYGASVMSEWVRSKYWEKNVSYCHFVDHKSHKDWPRIEPRPPWCFYTDMSVTVYIDNDKINFICKENCLYMMSISINSRNYVHYVVRLIV